MKEVLVVDAHDAQKIAVLTEEIVFPDVYLYAQKVLNQKNSEIASERDVYLVEQVSFQTLKKDLDSLNQSASVGYDRIIDAQSTETTDKNTIDGLIVFNA